MAVAQSDGEAASFEAGFEIEHPEHPHSIFGYCAFFGDAAGDKLHPTLKGYQVWADELKPIFTELLGPPAKEDRAPAPTGDPGARR